MARERRRYIVVANNDANFIQVKASFALSGIELDDDDAEIAGRTIVGNLTAAQGEEEILRKLGYSSE